MPEKAKRRQWLKYLFRGLLLLVVLVLVFYQQIFFAVAQLVAHEFAKSQAYSLQFKIHGSIFSSLYLEDLHLQALPQNSNAALERLDARWVAVRYNLFRLLKKDFLNVIELVELKKVDVVVRPTSAPPQKNPSGLRLPQLLPKKIDLQEVNLIVRNQGQDFEVTHFALQFQQGADGRLGCETLRLPGIGVWHQLQAGLHYSRNKLLLTDLALEPLVRVHQLQVDLSGSEEGQYHMTLDGQALGGSVAAKVSYIQPGERPLIHLAMNATDLQLEPIKKLWSLPVAGSAPKLEIQFDGEPDRPSTFSGAISAAGSGLRYQDYVVGTATISLVIHQGKGELKELSVDSGPNKVRLTGSFNLPETWDELQTGSSANIGIAASVSEPERYVPGLNAVSLSTGSIRLLNGRAQAIFRESVAGIRLPQAMPGAFVSGVSSTVFAVARLPASKAIWPSLAAAVFSDCANISYQDARIQHIGIAAETMDGKTATTSTDVQSGASRIQISTQLPLPLPDQSFDPKQVRGELTFHLASISDFIRQNLIQGTLTANGDLRLDRLRVGGTVGARGSQLSYRGMILQSLSLDAVFKDGEADLHDFRLGFDPDNYVHFTGSAKMNAPFPFQGNGEVAFKDVAVLNEFLRNLGLEPGMSGGLKVDFVASGDVHNPAAKLQVSGRQLQYRGVVVQDIDLRATAEKTNAEIQMCRLTLDKANRVDLRGTAQLAEPYPYAVNGTIALTDLAVFNGLINNLGQPGELAGVLNGSFSVTGDAHHPGAQIQLSGQQFKYRGLQIPSIRINAAVEDAKAELKTCRIEVNENDFIEVTGAVGIAAPFAYQARGEIALGDLGAFNEVLKNAGQPADLAGGLDVNVSGKGDMHDPTAQLRLTGEAIQYRGLPIQNINVEAHLENLTATIGRGRITLDAANFVDFTADLGLSSPHPYTAKGAVELNDLGVFKGLLNRVGETSAAKGNIHANWSLSGDARSLIPDGNLRVTGGQIKYRGLTIQSIDIDGNLLQKKLQLPSCKVTFNKDNFLDAKGDALLEDPYNYEANATIQFQDLGFLNELIKSFGQDLGLAGKLNASWKGNGPLKEQIGDLELHGDRFQIKGIQNVKFDASAHYQGFQVEVPRFQLSSPYADADAAIRFSPQWFEIPQLNIRRDGNAITGNLKIPLDLESGRKVPLALGQPIELDIQGNKIALNSFQTGKPQVTGTIGFRLQASQTLQSPLIEFTANARDVRSTSISSLSAATGDLSIHIADKVLTAEGKIQQPDIHPLTLTGRMPLDLGQIIQNASVSDKTPLQFALKWPDNDLAFVRKIVPDIKVVEGRVGADVTIGGTIKRPDLAGSINASLSRFQTTDAVPPISDFVAKIAFQRDHIQIAQLKGLAGGGGFGMNGGIDLKDGTNPRFDLGVTGNQVLLVRTDGIIVRANLNLAIRGPLSSGEVSGTVGITDSRFFKDIDILPLNLPGRPPPQVPTAALPRIAVETPPFKDWKFNIAVRTDDLFLIQSNLARGKVTINLQVGGTGAAPSLTGYVRIDRLLASLPFSKMEIENGSINFVQGGNMLDPSLSITGHSTVSDYEVRARIFGNVSNPTVFLDSSPPLAQGDILVLLATGSPSSTYEQNPSLLAGRATFAVLQQAYKKLFPSTNRSNQQRESFSDRFSVNVAPGEKAGEQDIVSQFKLTKNWEIIGDFGTSSYQGRLKYLVRFR
ncbi:MAG: translocation/assembly module TamB domain-containing protein [Verrucomicrobia bacterium]|nr:translocation/assembly module TamB domain-containing protein [Verrucomicrobiota bacterium]